MPRHLNSIQLNYEKINEENMRIWCLHLMTGNRFIKLLGSALRIWRNEGGANVIYIKSVVSQVRLMKLPMRLCVANCTLTLFSQRQF